eukprot:XP_001707171.1 Hypothetical protein GL50803_21362 [Giardia lamblia ATCC 50803]
MPPSSSCNTALAKLLAVLSLYFSGRTAPMVFTARLL